MDKLTDKIRRPKQPAKHCSSRIHFTLDDLSIQYENGQNQTTDKGDPGPGPGPGPGLWAPVWSKNKGLVPPLDPPLKLS